MKPVILVVDDDSAICELLCDVLSAHVFDVLVCQTGGEAGGYFSRPAGHDFA